MSEKPVSEWDIEDIRAERRRVQKEIARLEHDAVRREFVDEASFEQMLIKISAMSPGVCAVSFLGDPIVYGNVCQHLVEGTDYYEAVLQALRDHKEFCVVKDNLAS